MRAASTVVTSRAAAWLTRRFEQHSFVYGSAIMRLPSLGSTMAAADGAPRSQANGLPAATAAKDSVSVPRRARCSSASQPWAAAEGVLEHGVDRGRVDEQVVQLDGADAQVVGDEVLVGLDRRPAGLAHRGRRTGRGPVVDLGADHQCGPGAVPHRGQGGVDDLLLGDADLGHDRVGASAAPMATPTSRAGSGWVHVPFGVPIQPTARQYRAAGVVPRPPGGLDHELDQGRHRPVRRAVDDLADARPGRARRTWAGTVVVP